LLQNRAILRNGLPTSLPLVSSEKHAAQHPEKLRKNPSLNYETVALPAELRRREAGKNITSSGGSHKRAGVAASLREAKENASRNTLYLSCSRRDRARLTETRLQR
jgi:hypothetical protein